MLGRLLSNHRLLDLDGGKVTFRYKDYRQNEVLKSMALAAARASLGVDPESVPEKKPRAERIRDLLEPHLGHPISQCPDCGAKDSLIRILLPPNVFTPSCSAGARAPPADFVYVVVK